MSAEPPRVGDEVVVRTSIVGADARYKGRRGVVEFVDRHTPLNVRVCTDVGTNWFGEGELMVIEEREESV